MKLLCEVCGEADSLIACKTGIDWRTDISSFPQYSIYFMLGFAGNLLKRELSCLQSENSSGCGILRNETTYPHPANSHDVYGSKKIFRNHSPRLYKIKRFNDNYNLSELYIFEDSLRNTFMTKDDEVNVYFN
jgi:hypothetical protein